MKRYFYLCGCLPLAGCNPAPGASSADASEPLPRAGRYDIVRTSEVLGSPQPMKEETSNRCLSDRDREELASLFAGKATSSGCHDVEADVGEGRFALVMRCDTPEGDITNIPVEIEGTYDNEEIEVRENTSVYGVTQMMTRRYRRVGDC